jgi:hypothetical protein
VQWVDPQAFARISSESDALLPAVPVAANATPGAAAATPSADVAKKPKNDWLPWSSRR